MKKISLNDINNLLAGNSWYSTGGGFPSKKAREMFTKILKKQRFILKSLEEFEDEDYLCVASGVGSVNITNIDITKRSAWGVKMLEKIVEHKIVGVISGETGLECLAADTAAKLHLPLVDTDMKGGRAAPEPPINMFTLNRKEVTPMVAINTNGDISTLHSVAHTSSIELFLRNFANMARGCFVAWCPQTVKEFKKTLISKTISRSIRLGELIETKVSLNTLLKKTGGEKIFSGAISEIRDENDRGFLIRKIEVKNKTNRAKVWIKNENLVVTINNMVTVTCPDLITFINPRNNRGIHNSVLKIGMKVIIIAIPHDKKWHTVRGHQLFSPHHFGLLFDVKRI